RGPMTGGTPHLFATCSPVVMRQTWAPKNEKRARDGDVLNSLSRAGNCYFSSWYPLRSPDGTETPPDPEEGVQRLSQTGPMKKSPPGGAPSPFALSPSAPPPSGMARHAPVRVPPPSSCPDEELRSQADAELTRPEDAPSRSLEAREPGELAPLSTAP